MDGMTKPSLKDWTGCKVPGDAVLSGTYARLEPLDWAQHRDGLYAAVAGEANRNLWDYMPVGPFEDGAEAFENSLEAIRQLGGWRTMVIRDKATLEILGMASYMRIREAFGSAEVGCVAFGEKLKRTRIASEAIYLMAAYVFDDLGYRRFEWKCDDANAASMRAATRFGFSYEGTFRQDMVVKGRNRDSAWYSMLDSEWPGLKAAFRAWLAQENFTAAGTQKASLESYREGL
ncbi:MULTISPECIES: GNAT family N-acetyltransferase [Kordiimonas]|jgi:RimJ/RimL family protein N-acetyltransferase|uniref:GNAT family N-acetyltransferase n=1 Tax=Kordiimonas TaxID=288021 RepID=UPI00257FF93E|nr:GNAT family protein [Kordiimonas sp. UBA4487]